MLTSNILILALGLLTYWVVKFIGVKKADNPIRTVGAFFSANLGELLLSVIGIAFVILAGPALPPGYINLDTPVTAFISGGSIPSIINNVSALFNKKP